MQYSERELQEALKKREELVTKKKKEVEKIGKKPATDVLYGDVVSEIMRFKKIKREKEYCTHPIKTPETMTFKEFLDLVASAEQYLITSEMECRGFVSAHQADYEKALTIEALQEAEELSVDQENFVIYLGDCHSKLYERYSEDQPEVADVWKWLKKTHSSVVRKRCKVDSKSKEERRHRKAQAKIAAKYLKNAKDCVRSKE